MTRRQQNAEAIATVRTILIVEDDQELQIVLGAYLSHRGYEPSNAPTAHSAREMFERQRHDAVILDVGLPDVTGFELLQEMRPGYDGVIIMITGGTSRDDVVTALELGADDYIQKPFEPVELVARIRAASRRPRERKSEPSVKDEEKTIAKFGGLTLDLPRRIVARGKGHRVVLTRSEFDLLMPLLNHPKKVLTRDQIVEAIQPGDVLTSPRAVDTRINRLRAKIEDNPRRPQLIVTEYGLGYILLADVEWV